MKSSYAVAIVGAGPTGLALANILGAANIDTLLIEANSSTGSEPRAVSIDDESLRVVQGLGLIDIVQNEIISGYGSEYLGPSGHSFLKVKPRAQPYGHARRNAFQQPTFEAQLHYGLGRFPAVESRFSWTLDDFAELDDSVHIFIKQGGGATETIEVAYLIACDGARSSTRTRMGGKLEGSSLDERWLIIDLANSPAPSPETIVFCDSRRPGIALPGPRTTRRYEFKLHAEETDEEMLAEARVSELLAAHQVAAGSTIIRKTVYHFHARVADRWGTHRVWLAGDAAHLMPPFAGQGMNSGVRDAANIGWKLAEVVQGRIGPLLLRSYEQERRYHVQGMIRLALRMGAIMGPRSPLHGLITRGLFQALKAWPAARSFFAEMKYKPPPQFKDGFLLKTRRSRRDLVGRMLQQPKLALAGDSPILLDDLLGNGFALIGIDFNTNALERISLGPIWDPLLANKVALSAKEIPEFAHLSGKLILLRPDRYVMACFSAADRADTIKALETLWRSTWPPKTMF
jgi:3-(3-hydroxy-phenyl)propionate hydroxylase